MQVVAISEVVIWISGCVVLVLLVSGMKLVITGPCWSLRMVKLVVFVRPKVSVTMMVMLFSFSSPSSPSKSMVVVKVPSGLMTVVVSISSLLMNTVTLSRFSSVTVPWKMIWSSSVSKGGLLRSMSGLIIPVISSVGIIVSTSMVPERVNVLLTRSVVVMDTDFWPSPALRMKFLNSNFPLRQVAVVGVVSSVSTIEISLSGVIVSEQVPFIVMVSVVVFSGN